MKIQALPAYQPLHRSSLRLGAVATKPHIEAGTVQRVLNYVSACGNNKTFFNNRGGSIQVIHQAHPPTGRVLHIQVPGNSKFTVYTAEQGAYKVGQFNNTTGYEFNKMEINAVIQDCVAASRGEFPT